MRPEKLSFCGINSFSRPAEIDFSALLSGGIFGIFGDTGSGKTTILDSMIFALYGRADRAKSGGTDIINYNCDKANVSFEFSLEKDGARRYYRAEREIRRKNAAQKLALYEKEEAGWRYLKAIYANLKRYTVEGKPAFAVARGECQIGLQFESQYLEFLEQQFLNRQLGQGARHLAWYLPEQSPVLVDGIALIKGAPHPQEGRQFIDFCLSLEGQKIINRYFFSINPQLPPPPGLEGIDLETLLERAQPLDPQWMADNYDRVRQRWQNEVEASIEV